MSQLTWLPPLNSHDIFHISVHAVQGDRLVVKRRSASTLPKSLSVRLNVDVIFYSGDIQSKKTLRGLSILEKFEIFPILPSTSLEHTICDDLLAYAFVPFQLDGAYYRETRFFPMKQRMIETPVTEGVLIERLSGFLKDLVMDPTNTGLKKVRADLFIEKWIQLPPEELEAYIAWYEEQDNDEYMEAISRPRTDSELWEEEDVEALSEQVSYELCGDYPGDTQTCCVCFEDLGGGVRRLRRMTGCSHVFHELCIVRWLKTSHTCPLCRSCMLPKAGSGSTSGQGRASALPRIFRVTIRRVTSLLNTCFGRNG